MKNIVMWVLKSWSGAFIALVIVAGWWILNTLPKSDFWYEGHSIVIADTVQGTPVVLAVVREIKRPVYGEWSTTVRKVLTGGTMIYCSGQGASNYEPSTVLPEPLTLDWWVGENCGELEPGQYFVVTSWVFSPEWAIGKRVSSTLVSNVFRVHPKDSGF